MTTFADHRAQTPPLLRPMDLQQRHQVGELSGCAGDGTFWLSFEVGPEHCNLGGTCSGGIIASIMDIGMGLACCSHFGRLFPLPTISLTVDYIAPVPCGAVPLLTARLVRTTRTLGFAQAHLAVGSEVCVTGSGIFRLPGADREPTGPLDMIFVKQEAAHA